MGRRALGAILVAFSAYGAALRVPAASGRAGGSVLVPLTYTAQGSRVSALEWTLMLPQGAFTWAEAAAGPAASQSGKSAECRFAAPGQFHCLVSGMNTLALPDGVAAVVTLGIRADAAASSLRLHTQAAAASTPEGDAAAVDNGSNDIQILARAPQLASFTCALAGGRADCVLTLDMPAPPEGTPVAISGAPGIASITVRAGESAVRFFASVASLADMSAQLNGAALRASSIAECVVTVSSAATSAISADGALASLHINASHPGCPWTARSDAPWAQVQRISGSGSMALGVDVFPNFSRQARRGAVTVAGATVRVEQAGSSAPPNERAVRLLYQSFLGRAPAREEVALQARAIDTGDPAQLVEGFFLSPEFQNGGRFVAGMYEGILVRSPGYAEWAFQRQALTRGFEAGAALAARFLDSAEYAAKFGAPSDAEFVRLLYRHVLLREPDPAEVAFQAAALQRAPGGRPELAVRMLDSPEFRAGRGPRMTAFLLYACLLERDPLPGESAYWEDLFVRGMTLRQAIHVFMNSAELAAKIE